MAAAPRDAERAPARAGGSSARYIIGVDLGTTNTAVAAVDTRSAEQRVELFEIPQLVAPGAVDTRAQLPSFVYLAGEHDLGPAETALPWGEGWRPATVSAARAVVGELARAQGARQPSRMIASAKSWLCHGGVDRHAAILPWGAEGGPMLSPVDASAMVLRHVADAWDAQHAGQPDARFAEQDLIVTVPASFDEAARELTLEAAARAGLPPVVLLEEPQAAFYSWINTHAARRVLAAGDRVLVFDVGGGTTDFTLIDVRADGAFDRVAVGDHLLLGGDNIDLTLARTIEARLVSRGLGARLDAVAWHGLVHACRLAKEALMAHEDVASLPVIVTGRGAKLIGATIREDLTREELERIVLDGFFPVVARDEPLRRSRGGLQEFGLPYAADPAITRHLGAFLARHQAGAISAVLFNGGAMAPSGLRRRVLDQIAAWQLERGAPRELEVAAPERAVAEGAAYYGLVRRGLGVRIGGGTPRAFYVGVGAAEGRGTRAVCLAPKGLEEGATAELARDFSLVTNRPVSFKLYSSTTRDDRAGALVDLSSQPPEGGAVKLSSAGSVAPAAHVEDVRAAGAGEEAELLELPPIVTAIRAPGRGEVIVRLQVRVTELGTVEVMCAEREPSVGEGAEPGAWRLSFDMRAGGAKASSSRPEGAGERPAEPDPKLPEAQAVLRDLFAGPPEALARLVKLLEQTLGAARDAWPTPTARALFDSLLELEEQRKRSAHHEARWLNLTGFCLRPGLGAPLDEWRSKQMWRVFHDELVHASAEQCRIAWWIVWRRIAGGLNKGQQHQIYLRLAQLFLPGGKGKKKWQELKPSPEEAAEMLRCLANMERLSPEAKIPVGDELVRRFATRKGREDPLNLWALARLGARVPLYGPLNCVVAPGKAGEWLHATLDVPWPEPAKAAFPIAQLARRTGDRARDVEEPLRIEVASWLRRIGAERASVLVEQVVALEAREQYIALGDTLPPGLRLVADESGSD